MLEHYAFALFILASGALMLIVFWQSLKRGYLGVDLWPYITRTTNPIGYWISQIAMALVGLLFVGAGLSGLFVH